MSRSADDSLSCQCGPPPAPEEASGDVRRLVWADHDRTVPLRAAQFRPCPTSNINLRRPTAYVGLRRGRSRARFLQIRLRHESRDKYVIHISKTAFQKNVILKRRITM